MSGQVCLRANLDQTAAAAAGKDLSSRRPDSGILALKEQYIGSRSVARSRPKGAAVLVAWMVASLGAPPVRAAALKRETAAAFDRYVQVTEAQMDEGLQNGDFLLMDRWPERRRAAVKAQLRRGDIYVEHLHTLDDNHSIPIPHGMVHDWIGIAFIPGATLAETLGVLRDYDNHHNIYKPEVRASKLLERNGNTSKTYVQFYSKSIVTVALNANFTVDFTQVTPAQAETRSHSTRVAELDHAGGPDERELPVGKDHGYLWRLDSYWRLEEADGGVYIQVESVALSRGIPLVVAWFVDPLVHRISRAFMSNLVAATRKAVTEHNQRLAGLASPPPAHRSAEAGYAAQLVPVSSAGRQDRP